MRIFSPAIKRMSGAFILSFGIPRLSPNWTEELTHCGSFYMTILFIVKMLNLQKSPSCARPSHVVSGCMNILPWGLQPQQMHTSIICWISSGHTRKCFEMIILCSVVSIFLANFNNLLNQFWTYKKMFRNDNPLFCSIYFLAKYNMGF